MGATLPALLTLLILVILKMYKAPNYADYSFLLLVPSPTFKYSHQLPVLRLSLCSFLPGAVSELCIVYDPFAHWKFHRVPLRNFVCMCMKLQHFRFYIFWNQQILRFYRRIVMNILQMLWQIYNRCGLTRWLSQNILRLSNHRCKAHTWEPIPSQWGPSCSIHLGARMLRTNAFNQWQI
jgi:hypothetical protein